MLKSAAVLVIFVCLLSIGGCGDGSKTGNITVYELPSPVAAPTTRAVMGGAVQGTGAIAFNNYSVSTFSGSDAGFINHSTAASPGAKFNRPIAVTTDGTKLYVADYYNNAIRQIVIETGVVSTLAGSVSGGIGSVDATGTAASFYLPSGITTDGNSLFVTDSGNYTIRKIDLATGAVTTLAGIAGRPGSVDAPTGTNAQFNLLNGITTDGVNLYVTDSSNTIRKIVIAGGAVTTLAGAPGTTGSADGIQAAARFNLPARITTDGPNLYVADFGNSTIRKIALIDGSVTTIAGAVGPSGSSGSHADSTDGTGLTARFNQPNGITTDGVNLYVTESFVNTIRKIVLSPGTPYSGAVTTIAGTAAGAVGSLDGRGTEASFHTPIGITTDGISLFIADIENHRIRRIQ